jgi:integrase
MAAKVYERKGRGRWIVRLHWKGKEYTRYHYDEQVNFVHIEMARQIASAINADISKKGKAFDPRQWFRTPGYEFQFDQYSDRWLTCNQMRYAPNVRRDVNRYVGFATEFFKKTDLREIRKIDFKDFLEWLPGQFKKNPSEKTLKNVMTVLHKVFSDAHDDELLQRIPPFPKISPPDPETRWISKEWQRKIIDEIPEHDRPIFIFMCTWGARPGEARALQWDCIDFETETICIRRTFSGAGCNYLQQYTKTRRIRFLPFTDELRDVFKEIRGIAGFVFRNRQGRPYTSDISRTWNEARDKVGAPPVTLYEGTRHSFATQNAEYLSLVQQVLGHSRADMTNRYRHMNMDKIKEAFGNGSHTVSQKAEVNEIK